MDAMKISVIVPAYNEAKMIAATCRSVWEAGRAFAGRGWELELIVCDNNSTDQTAELARKEGARVTFEGVNQIGRARNMGAKAAGGDWLVFVDADSRPSAELLEGVAREIESGRTLAGGSTVVLDEQNVLGNIAVRGWNVISRVMRWAAGSFIFCESTGFWEAGGFNEELYVSEELDLSRRLKRVARRRKQRFIILTDAPLTTSARKIHLYSMREHMGFFVRAALQPSRVTRSRAACGPWYDGRR